MRENGWLRMYNLTKRDINLVTLEEVGSGSFETTIATQKTTSISTATTKTTLTSSNPITSNDPTQTSIQTTITFSEQTSALTSKTVFTSTTQRTTQSLALTTTTADDHVCTDNVDCSNVYGKSACVLNRCGCLPPSVLYENICTRNTK